MASKSRTQSITSTLQSNLYILSLISLILLGIFLMIRVVIAKDAVFGLILLCVSISSLLLIVPVWQWFSEKFAPTLIYIINDTFFGRKLIAGGAFSYYEYTENEEEIKPIDPIFRFISMTVAFLGISVTIISLASNYYGRVVLEAPAASLDSTIIWAVLLIVGPLLLTPVVPIIWVMEDLQIKAWDPRRGVNWRVADKFRVRFSRILAVGAIASGFASSSNPTETLATNIQNFLILLGDGAALLVLPISLYTVTYFIYFQGKVSRKTRERLSIKVVRTELIFDLKRFQTFEDKINEEKAILKAKSKEGKRKFGFLHRKKKEETNPLVTDSIEPSATVSPSTSEFQNDIVSSTSENSKNDIKAKKENLFLGDQEEITAENYQELEKKYFGKASERTIKRVPSKVKAEKTEDTPEKETIGQLPGKMSKKASKTVNNTFKKVGGLFSRKKESKEPGLDNE